ncbi:MAG: hypothetical protein H7835_20175 [Magnetococcus sp. XQGC-1]
MYSDYFGYESVWRVERELLNKFCQGYKFINLNELREKIEKKINFSFDRNEKKYIYTPKDVINSSYFSTFGSY